MISVTVICLVYRQNTAARLITRVEKFEHISPILHNLHWLPVKDRIDYKLLLITFRALHELAPMYITELFRPYTDLLAHLDLAHVIYLQYQVLTLQLMATEHSLSLLLNFGTPSRSYTLYRLDN